MPEQEELTQEQKDLQTRLLAEFMDPYFFGDQHDFAARAEITRLQAEVKALKAKLNQKGRSE